MSKVDAAIASLLDAEDPEALEFAAQQLKMKRSPPPSPPPALCAEFVRSLSTITTTSTLCGVCAEYVRSMCAFWKVLLKMDWGQVNPFD